MQLLIDFFREFFLSWGLWVRQALCSNNTAISFAGKLWQVKDTVSSGALDGLKAVVGNDAVPMGKDIYIECWFFASSPI